MISMAGWLLVWQPKDAIPQDRRGDVIIHYWEKWNGLEGVAIQQVVDDFNNSVGKEKHIYVDLLSMSNIDQKTLVATAAGVPPDVAGLWDSNIVQLGALGALEPLEDLAAQHGITASYYKPVYWRGCHFNGHLYALVSTPAAMALFYNTRIFHDNAAKLREAGLDPDRAPQTLQELDRYAEVLNTFKTGPDGKKHLDRAGFLPMLPGLVHSRDAGLVRSGPLGSQNKSVYGNRSGLRRGVQMDAKLLAETGQRRGDGIPDLARFVQFNTKRIHRRERGDGTAGTLFRNPYPLLETGDGRAMGGCAVSIGRRKGKSVLYAVRHPGDSRRMQTPARSV